MGEDCLYDAAAILEIGKNFVRCTEQLSCQKHSKTPNNNRNKYEIYKAFEMPSNSSYFVELNDEEFGSTEHVIYRNSKRSKF